MIPNKFLIAATGLCLAAAGPAFAQASPEDSASNVAARYAACLVAERPIVADAYLATQPGSPERSYTFNALVPSDDTNCSGFATAPDGSRLEIPEIVLTGYIAEARYIVRYPAGAPPVIASATPALMTDDFFNARIAAAPNPALEFPRIFGDCLVALRAQDTDTLVRTRPGSAEETAALQVLQPLLGQCLWNGQTLEFSRETLRAVLSDALYRKALNGGAAASEDEEDGAAGR